MLDIRAQERREQRRLAVRVREQSEPTHFHMKVMVVKPQLDTLLQLQMDPMRLPQSPPTQPRLDMQDNYRRLRPLPLLPDKLRLWEAQPCLSSSSSSSRTLLHLHPIHRPLSHQLQEPVRNRNLDLLVFLPMAHTGPSAAHQASGDFGMGINPTSAPGQGQGGANEGQQIAQAVKSM